MLEGLASWVLNNYLGKYFENVDTDQLSCGLLSGELELENVPLRKDALRHLDIPFQVVSGFVGRVKLQIPVTRFRSEPWVVVFEKLYGIVTPIKLNEYDHEEYDASCHDRKMSKLDGIEASWRAERASNSNQLYASSQTSWFNLITSVGANIAENIQLRVHDVHLRYEDDQSIPGRVFSAGLTIKSLTVQSTDNNWTPMFVRNSNGVNGISYKLLELTDMALYWDTRSNSLQNLEVTELVDELEESEDHQFLLKPITCSACVQRHLTPSPLKSRSQPRISCHLTISSFPVELTDEQYSQIVLASRLYDRLNRARQYLKWRPVVPVLKNAELWWKHAINCQLEIIQKRNKASKWDFVIERSKELVQYVEFYTKFLVNPTYLPNDCKILKEKVEFELGFSELKALRDIAISRVEETSTKPSSPDANPDTFSNSFEETEVGETSTSLDSSDNDLNTSDIVSAQGETLLWRWFPSWSGWYSQPDENIVPSDDIKSDSIDKSIYETPNASLATSDADVQMTSSPYVRNRTTSTSFEEELLFMLTDNIDNNTFTTRDAVFCQLSFSLKEGKCTLSTEKESNEGMKTSELCELEFSDVKIGLESRPRNKSFKFDIQLGSLRLRDQINKDPSFPYLISPQIQQISAFQHYKSARTYSLPTAQQKSGLSYSRSSSIMSDKSSNSSSSVDVPLFAMVYEHRPLNQQADHKLDIVSQPLDIIYNPDAFDAAMTIFLQPLKSKSKYHQQYIHQDPLAFSLAAKRKYDAILEQTKQEIRKNLDQVLQGGMRKSWMLNFDISAPQIIIPEHFKDPNSSLVVINLGRLTFCSANSPSKQPDDKVDTKANPASSQSTWGSFMSKIIGRNTDEVTEEDEEFATPCSTPDELPCDDQKNEETASNIRSNEPLTEELLHSHMYDKYDMHLRDMQVIVCKVKDNWRFSYHKGTGPMHLVDRFNLNVLVSRRTVTMMPSDRPWPTATVAATLPNVMLHLNQMKVHTLISIMNMIKKRNSARYDETPQTEPTVSTDIKKSDSISSLSNKLSSKDGLSEQSPEEKKKPKQLLTHESIDCSESTSTLIEDPRLLVMQLNIEKLSIELMSRGRSIAEVQVAGVKTIVQYRPLNYSASLTIHSFLLVDALQTFGPDFELLVASHKHITMDSVSGSFLGSDPCSPTSPASPDHSVHPIIRPTSPVSLNRALNALATSPQIRKSVSSNKGGFTSPSIASPPSFGIDMTEIDNEALISIEVTYISSQSPSQEGSGAQLIGSFQFNTIDIIANQETIVELVSFFHQLIPSNVDLESKTPKQSYQLHKLSEKCTSPATTPSQEFSKKLDNRSLYGSLAMLYENSTFVEDKPLLNKCTSEDSLRVNVCFDFTKLSVLLLRVSVKDKELVGRKIGTAVLSEAKIQTSLENQQLTVEGSLGGFQVRDITPESNEHQCIVSVGQDIGLEKENDVYNKIASHLYQSYAQREDYSQTKAFSFFLQRPLAFGQSTHSEKSNEGKEKLTLNLQLASVIYTHSPSFLQELSSCAEEFKQYINRVAQSIKLAATEVAMGLVSRRIESFANFPGYSSEGVDADSPLRRRASMAMSTETLHLPYPPPATDTLASPTHSAPSDLAFRLKLDITLDTPIIVLPESKTSSDVIIAQLGQISIKNTTESTSRKLDGSTVINHDETEEPDESVSKRVNYEVGVRDMSLYSLDINKRKDNSRKANLRNPVKTISDIYCYGSDCQSILHRTSIQIILSHQLSANMPLDNQAGMWMYSSGMYDMFDVGELNNQSGKRVESLEISGGVVNPIKLSLSRLQYHQLMATLSNISIQKHVSSSSNQQPLSSIIEEDGAGIISSPVRKRKLERTSTHGSRHSLFSQDFSKSGVGEVAKGEASKELTVTGQFSIPQVEVELVGDVNGTSQSLVNLILDDFIARYEKIEESKTTTKVTLKSLVLVDLLCSDKSPHRFLLKSVPSPLNTDTVELNSENDDYPPFISTSCPTRKEYLFPPKIMSCSLPTRLELEKPFFQAQKKPLNRSSNRKKRNFSNTFDESTTSLIGLFEESSTDGSQFGSNKRKNCPGTPPSSPTFDNIYDDSSEPKSDLVKINIDNINENHSDFMKKYDGNHKYVNIEFNSLVSVMNIPSWVMILDFFSMKQRKNSSNMSSEFAEQTIEELNESIKNVTGKSAPRSEDQFTIANERNTVIETSIVWLEVGFVRVDGDGNTGVEVAGASVSDISVKTIGSEGNLSFSGKLGTLSVTDKTSQGSRYRHKFITSGTEALTFQLYKYCTPDPSMLRECDMRLNIKMASVMYVHTQRFATELIHAMQQFTQLQNIVEKWRAIRAGHQLHDSRGSRISLALSAGSPVILLPLSGSGSNEVLVADLGSLEISNKFLWAGSTGTISKIGREVFSERLTNKTRDPSRSRSRSKSRNRHATSDVYSSKPPKCLLDVMKVTLNNIDLYIAERKERGKENESLKERNGRPASSRGIDIPGKISSEQCHQNAEDAVGISCKISSDNWVFPTILVNRKGQSLLREKCALILQVERNLDGHISRRVPDISVQGCLTEVFLTVDAEIYKLVRGLLQYNLGENLDLLHSQQKLLHHPNLPSHANIRSAPIEEVYVTLDIVLDLDNVTVKVLLPTEDDTSKEQEQRCLTCVNLIKSRLEFKSNSDGGKDVNLVSQEILLSDDRYLESPMNKRLNVFTKILQPSPSNTYKNDGPLQAELHYRATKELNRFTILVNNMRLMAILDWWQEVLSFIQLQTPNPYELSSTSPVREPSIKSESDLHKAGRSGVSSPTSLTAQSPRSSSPLSPKLSMDVKRINSGFSLGRLSPRINPLVESTGVMTKYSLLMHDDDGIASDDGSVQMDNSPIPFELKINISDSEIVIVENSAAPNSGALVFRNTTVLSYRPSMTERPLSCNLSRCEMYSCALSAEEETALSILDPVTVNIEMTDRSSLQPTLASGAFLSTNHIIEVTVLQINVRVSYHDLKMFQRIFQSIITSQEKAMLKQDVQHPANVKAQIDRLRALGFLEKDCHMALQESHGRLDDAALWLTRNCAPAQLDVMTDSQNENVVHPLNCQAIEIKTCSVNVCVIDDCGDCDVPLLEFTLQNLFFKQDRSWTGSAACSLSMNYYNRSLSGWEPLLEPWKCNVEWNKCILGNRQGCNQSVSTELNNGICRLMVQLNATELMQLNITSSLVDLFRMVRDNWTQDYYDRDRIEFDLKASTKFVESPVNYRRRCPFIPFTLLNETGSVLSFCTVTTFTFDNFDSPRTNPDDSQEKWTEISHGKSVPFSFQENQSTKWRHGDTHQHKMHQVKVRVQGWYPVGPITVDKVGTFFRMATAVNSENSIKLPSARVVLTVSLSGSARKQVTVRSALLLHNTLPCSIEAKLDNLVNRMGDVKMLHIPSQTIYPIPITYVWAGIKFRPLGNGGIKRTLNRSTAGGTGSGGWVHCSESIHWRMYTNDKEEHSQLVSCPAINASHPPYRLCVHIRRNNYPVESELQAVRSRPSTPPLMRRPSYTDSQHEWVQPAHTITLLSPLTLINLLPYELHYSIPRPESASTSVKSRLLASSVKSTSRNGFVGIIKPGDKSILHTVNQEESFQIKLWTENFSAINSLNIAGTGSSSTSSCQMLTLHLKDSADRNLDLVVKVTRCYGQALKLSVLAHYWIFNNTGLPLIFKQDTSSNDAAAQESEHEVARCGAPLLFSFSDREAPPMLCMRVGNRLHQRWMPHTCYRMSLTQGTQMRRLRVSPPDNRPDVVYIVGVDVRPGKGRFSDTLMVTVSPRFKIENRSSHELLVAQTCCTDGSVTRGENTWLNCLPGSFVAFHWPRLDKDALLSVRLLSSNSCHWSGGFTIDRIDSFHLNIRGAYGDSVFLRVETLVKNATHYVVICDPEQSPPPFRVDNFSEVPVTYFQTGTQHQYVRSIIKPHCSSPYSWDEPTLPPHLTCIAPGGDSATYNLNELRKGAQLTYENFIYIAFTGTFPSDSSTPDGDSPALCLDSNSLEAQQLVLDVVEGNKIILARKQMGQRSQLWRMTSTGKLQHEGSSPPVDPLRPRKEDVNAMVLDISTSAPQPHSYSPLMLRKPDPRRQMTQTWQFTEDGRLSCKHHRLYVQAKDGFLGLNAEKDDAERCWRPWNSVVLGPSQSVEYCRIGPAGIPLEQAITRQRLRPGSGILSLEVVTDGPTRVMQITDFNNNQAAVARTDNGGIVTLCGSHHSGRVSPPHKDNNTEETPKEITELQVQVSMSGGVGLSVVQQMVQPVELVYLHLSDIIFGYHSTPHHRTLDCTVRSIQLDNQITRGVDGSVLIVVTPQSKTDESRHLPALNLAVHQLLQPNTSTSSNAFIFKNLRVCLKNLSITIEEEVVCRLLQLAGFDSVELEPKSQSNSTQSVLSEAVFNESSNISRSSQTRFYFGLLELKLNEVRLSVVTKKHLSPDLKRVRRKMGLNSLVSFENAHVSLKPFVRNHPFETANFLLDNIKKHYVEQLSTQALRILGSTDFLGNPSGFLADVSEGMSELVHQWSLEGLLSNVTHGMANSAAKMSGSLSDSLGRVTMDDNHEALRQQLMTRSLETGNHDQVINGLRGLTLGLYGGFTSILAQTITGVQRDGVPGLFSGLAKGVVGTVTKPAVGVLDMFSGAAYAVRDSSKTPLSRSVRRLRYPRVVLGLTGLLPPFDERLANGQYILKTMPNYCPSEILIAFESLRTAPHDMRILVSSLRIRVFTYSENETGPNIVLNALYSSIIDCRASVCNNKRENPIMELIEEDINTTEHCIEITLSTGCSSAPSKPRVLCDTQELAQRVSQQINCARNLHAELSQSVPETEDVEEE